MANNNTVSIGNAGEYFVAGELERHGFTVAIPMSNVKDFDILAINRTTYQQYSYFDNYNLKLSKYEVTKRQTNDADKTDFVWMSLKGENEDFLYKASYKITYIKYNDGWRIESFDVVDSSYEAKNKPSNDKVCSDLSDRYTNIESVERVSVDSANCASYKLVGEAEDKYVTNTYDITITYEFTPTDGWKEVSETTDLKASRYNIVGEWSYEDDEHLYYIHISEVSENILSMKYTFWNKSVSPDDEYWQIRQADYATYEIINYDNHAYYWDVGWQKTYNKVDFGDNDYIWLCNHEATIKGIVDTGIVVNNHFLKQISKDLTDDNYPTELMNVVKNHNAKYSNLPEGLFDATLIQYLGYFDMSFSELEPLIKKTGINQKYSLEKVNFIDHQVTASLWVVPKEDSKPSAIELTGTEYSVEELREYFQKTLGLQIYEDNGSSFIVILPNTNIKLRVRADVYSAKVTIYPRLC